MGINYLPPNVGILKGTSPALVDYNGLLYCFYVGSGKEGIFYTSCDSNGTWSQRKLCTDPVKANPSAIQYDGKIFLFYVPEGTIWMNYQVFDGKTWTKTKTIGHDATLLEHSSPAGFVFNDRLYVIFNGSGNDGLWYKKYNAAAQDFEGQVKCDAKGLGLWQGTSPAPVEYQNKLYVFYNGSGNDGTWYVTYDGSQWSSAVSIRGPTNGSFEKGTSPTTFVIADNKLMVMWSGSGLNGTWYSYFDGSSWTYQQSVDQQTGGQNLMNGTMAAGIYWGQITLTWSVKDGTKIAETIAAKFNPETIKFN